MKKKFFQILSIVLIVLIILVMPKIITNEQDIRVTEFTLIDVDKGESIIGFDPIQNGMTINLTALSTKNINVIAKTEPEIIGSVVFKLNNTVIRTENTPPYTLAGDQPTGNYSTWTPELGWQNLTAIPYLEKEGRGDPGISLSISIIITETPRIEEGPLPGQIVVDPTNPSWLNRYKENPFFLCGPGDPEEFLYRGTLNPDGTRNGDQRELINKLKGTGANSIYLQVVRSHGGDGESTHNPFIENDPKKGLNYAILDQWEEWFNEMDENGIVIYFFFYDDGAIVWDTGDDIGKEEKSFIHELVGRFEHHKNLIWVVTEEFQGRYSVKRLSNIAAEIRSADSHPHVIAIHHSAEQEMAFPDDPNVDQYAIQFYSPPDDRDEYTRHELHEKIVKAWEKADGRYNLNMAEADKWGTGETARKKSWAVAMGGSYVMILWMDIENTPISDLEDCGRLVRFMEMTDFTVMSPNDDLAYMGTEYVLANPGESYIAYASSLDGEIGIRKMSSGIYNFLWYDIPSGTTFTQENIQVQGGDQIWEKPESIGIELALYIKKVSDKKLVFPGISWDYKSPIEVGMNSSKLDELESILGGHGAVVKDGYIVKTWGSQTYVREWASSSKPVLSTLLLFAVNEGRIDSVDSLVGDWSWELLPKDENMTFRHLANMVSGYARPEKPGDAYAYNDRAIQLYYLTLERVFEQSLNEAAVQRLHSQLQIEGTEIFNSNGRVILTLQDFARICWFWLNNGNWDGTQILPKVYFDNYMKPGVPQSLPYAPYDHYENDYLEIDTYGSAETSRRNSVGPGIYGFNWWFNAPGRLNDYTYFDLTWPDAPSDSIMTLGWGEHNSVIIPSLNLVLVSAEGDWGRGLVSQGQEGKSTNGILKILVESIIDEN
jgi:hypothetical protein